MIEISYKCSGPHHKRWRVWLDGEIDSRFQCLEAAQRHAEHLNRMTGKPIKNAA